MTQPSLDDALDKLRWAGKHLEILREQIEPFEQRDAHTITVEVDADAGEYAFYVRGLEPPDPDWGLIVGDCLHNARTALDYLVVRLFALVTGQEPRDIEAIQFPIYDDPGKFKSCAPVAEMRKHPAFSGYLARVEELQPFNLGNPSVWGPPSYPGPDAGGILIAGPHFHPLPSALSRLSMLDNIDKHRVVHAAWVGVNVWRAMHREADIAFPPEFKQRSSSTAGEPLANDAEVGRLYFETPLPSDWQPDQVQMKRAFPLQVAIDEPFSGGGVLEVLPFCLWGVESVLALFAPVFSGRHPPLPVTAIPAP